MPFLEIQIKKPSSPNSNTLRKTPKDALISYLLSKAHLIQIFQYYCPFIIIYLALLILNFIYMNKKIVFLCFCFCFFFIINILNLIVRIHFPQNEYLSINQLVYAILYYLNLTHHRLDLKLKVRIFHKCINIFQIFHLNFI